MTYSRLRQVIALRFIIWRTVAVALVLNMSLLITLIDLPTTEPLHFLAAVYPLMKDFKEGQLWL